ncbi:MAG TPA: acireductone synthase [Pyrinomonadaceae bacterium]|nr:acireductone synthase [Pyrinomonadaceae bacterium]
MTNAATEIRALLLDIEGTITPISFVHDILFPFARNHVRDYLSEYFGTANVQEDVAALKREHALDQERGEQPPRSDNSNWSIDTAVAYVNWLIERDRKSPALKSLQGKIWEKGYRDGTLKAPLFDDVITNLQRLRARKLRTAIFSSGSVLAQKLLLAHTNTGDHTELIDQYFDTGVGSKVSSASYLEIARRLELLPEEIIFVSDVTNELNAGREAGMTSLLCLRPGNPPQSAGEHFDVIQTFSEILPAPEKTNKCSGKS